MHHTIIAVDVEGFSTRDAAHQRKIHEGLQPLVQRALERSGLTWSACYHEDRGDGLFVLAPPNADSERLAECLPNELAGRLREFNHGAAAGASIRLRVVLHAGDVARDPHGVAGPAVITAFRLLDAEELRRALTRSHGVVAFITSDEFFHAIIHSHPAANPRIYEKVHVTNKGMRADAWICLPDNHNHRAEPKSGPTHFRSPRHQPPPPAPARSLLDRWWAALGLAAAILSTLALWWAGWYLPYAMIAGLLIGVVGFLTASAVAVLASAGVPRKQVN